MHSIVERLKTRKRLGATIDVEFMPTSLYAHYIATDLQPDVKPGKRRGVESLTDDERAKAKAKYLELRFTFKLLAGEERRQWEREAMRVSSGDGLPTDRFEAYIVSKLKTKFVSGEHIAPATKQITSIDSTLFEELLGELNPFELMDLKNQFYQAHIDAMRHAEKNELTAAPAGGTQ